MIVLSVRKSTLFFMLLLFCVILAVSFADFPAPFIWFACENDMQ